MSLRSIAFLAAAIAAPLSAQTLPGVSNQETVIPFAANGGIREYHFGEGDVTFLRDRANRWYRVALNKGCLAGFGDRSVVAFDTQSDGQLDRSSRVLFAQPRTTCLIDSIRRSAPPPQIKRDTPTTLN